MCAHMGYRRSSSGYCSFCICVERFCSLTLTLHAACCLFGQVHASLIVVLTRGGSTGRLVAKYRPLVPVLTVAVPVLTTDSLTWTCSNEAPARQVCASRETGCGLEHAH